VLTVCHAWAPGYAGPPLEPEHDDPARASAQWILSTVTVGHKSTHVTETVYRHVIVPAIRSGANVMDTVFGDDPEDGSGAADVSATP
jgi:hypothetical protein